MRVGLVGCVSEKRAERLPARDLYCSPLFGGRRHAVEKSCDCWFILSAKLGLVAPDTVIEPYDLALTDRTAGERRAWSTKVLKALADALGDVRGHTFEIHAGDAYRGFGLEQGLVDAGAVCVVPMKGLGLGKQLRAYKKA